MSDEMTRLDETAGRAEPTGAVERAAEAILEACYGQELPEAPIDLARAALVAALDVEKAGHELDQIGAIDKRRPADAGPWVNAPLSVVVAHLLGGAA